MVINKHAEFFNPAEKIKAPVHIIGLGAIGSNLAEMLVRIGVTQLHLYDFDCVVEHNIANQLYLSADIGKPKIECLANYLTQINPEVLLALHDKGYDVENTPQLNGYIFLCVDSIETRQIITKAHLLNPYVTAMFDFRMRLEDAQHYAANWTIQQHKDQFLASMDFTDAEAKSETPISACGSTLSINSTIKSIVSFGVSNFINLLNEKPLRKVILIDAFNYVLDAF